MLPRSPPPECFTPPETSMPGFVGAMYTSSGRSLGLNGCLFVHFGHPRSSASAAECRPPPAPPALSPPTPRPPPLAARPYNPRSPGARSSVGERSLHTREVAGSKPAAPTRNARFWSDPRGGPSANWCQNPALREGLQPRPVLLGEAHPVRDRPSA